MADYWKSLPRKFCTFCKCWITDNKPSIEFHEKGKKHQENVQIKIAAIRKKGQKDFEEQKSYENEMKKIEKAALKAFKKDLESNPELIKQISPSIELPPNTPSSAARIKPKREKQTDESKRESLDSNSRKDRASCSTEAQQPSVVKVWYEAVSDEGYTYYWNTETGESKWECPEGECVSIQEQKEQSSNIEDNVEKDVAAVPEEGIKEEDSSLDEKDDNEEINNVIGPQPKNDPYGQWTTVEIPEPVNLQLPEHEQCIEIKVTVPAKETHLKFKERTVTTLRDKYASEEEVEFKKRKLISGKKRNLRRRESDD